MHRTGIAPRKDLPDPMSDHMTASPASVSPAQAAERPGALRIIGLAAVGVGLAALAGAAFVLSYGGIHAFALQAGISGRLARGYPLIFDVLLVVILAAVLALRGAGLPSKVLAWACLLALVSAAAGADALHAAGRKLPAQDAAVTAAVVPWVLVLIAFALLLAMLRQARLRRLAGNRVTGRGQPRTRWQPEPQPPAPNLPLVPGFGGDELAATAPPVEPPRAAEPPAVEPTAAEPAAVSAPAVLAASAVETPADTVESVSQAPSDLAGSRRVTGETPEGEPALDADDQTSDGDLGSRDDSGSADAGDDRSAPGEATDPEMPVFHRMWSSPAPPAGQ